MTVSSAARLLALAAFFFSRNTLASFDGMAGSAYKVPVAVQDGVGNTSGSTNFKERGHGAVPAAGPAGVNSSNSTNFKVWAGHLHRFPTYTQTSTRTVTRTFTRTATPTFTRTATPTHTRTISPTFSQTITPSFTGTITPSFTASITATFSRTATPSATPTRSSTPTYSATSTRTSTATPSATATRTPFAVLSLLKSADVSFVNQSGNITYTLLISNNGSYPANNLTVWDTVDSDVNYLSSVPAETGAIGALRYWSLPSLSVGQSTSVVFSVVYPGIGPNPVDNLFSASAQGVAQQDSNIVNTGFGAAFTATFTQTPTVTATETSTSTITPSFSSTGTQTPTATPTFTASITVSFSNTQSSTQTPTQTSTQTPTYTASPTSTQTPTRTPTSTATATETSTSSETPSSTETSTQTPTNTATPSSTRTITSTHSHTATRTVTHTNTRTVTETFTATATPTRTGTSTMTGTRTFTRTSSPSSTASPSFTATATPSDSATETPTATETASPSNTRTGTPTPSSTRTASPTATATVTHTPMPPSLSFAKLGPATALESEILYYQLVITNGGGAGPANNVSVSDTLPAGVTFTGPGSLQGAFYPGNDAWRQYAGNLIVRGPFSVNPGQSLTVNLQVQVALFEAGNTISNNATAWDVDFETGASAGCSTLINSGVPTQTPTYTISPSFTHSPTVTSTVTSTRTVTATNTGTATTSSTRTPSPTVTRTITITSTRTASPSATSTATPFAVLSLLKSADVNVVANPGDRITYILNVSNPGGADASLVTLWDTLHPSTTYLDSSPAISAQSGNLISWNVGTLASGATQSFTFSVSYSAAGANVNNLGSAQAGNVSRTDSNQVNVAFGTAFTHTSTRTITASSTPTPSQTSTETAQPTGTSTGTSTPTSTASPSSTETPSATGTPTPSPSATSTPVLVPVPINVSLALVAPIQNWFESNTLSPPSQLRFRIRISGTAGTYQSIPDLVVRFIADPQSGNIRLTRDSVNSPGNPFSTMGVFSWKQNTALAAGGLETGEFQLDPGSFTMNSGFFTNPVDVYAQIESGAQDATITSRVWAYSAALGVSTTVNLNTYILDQAPTPTPATQATSSPTPVASAGKIVCYPQPAKDTMCFAYHAVVGGKLEIIIFNSAFQVVGRVKDTAAGGVMETSCIDVTGMAPGVYFYKTKVGDFAFPMQQFGIAR